MQTRNPNFRQKVFDLFERATFVNDLGVRLDSVDVGVVETSLAIEPRHAQQDGYVHAGVQATLADHTAGAAAGSLVAPGETILSIEFKINMLRPAVGSRLRCRATVLKPGRTVIVTEAEIFASDGEVENLTSKATVTLVVVPEPTKA